MLTSSCMLLFFKALPKRIAESCPGQFRSVYRIEPLLPKNFTLWPFQRWIKLVLSCLFAVLCQGLPAASYFVAKTGSDSNPGTSALPFLTVQKGVKNAQAGDTVLVGAGTYSETVTSARSGASGSRIVVDGQGVATIHSILLAHQYLTLQDCTIAGKASGWWMFMAHGAHNCVISNNVFDGEYNTNMFEMLRWDTPESGHLPWGTNVASDTLVISNTFKRSIGMPVITVFGDRNVIKNNRLIDGDAVDWFRVWGRTNYIVGNLCSNLFFSGIENNHPDFFQSFGLNGHGAKAIIIESNLVIGAHQDAQLCMFEGQDCVDLRDFTFRNNLFIGVSAKGTMACPDVKWYNNVFYNCSTNPLTAGSALIFAYGTNPNYTNRATTSGHGGQVFNNVFLNCGDGRTSAGWYSFDTQLTNVLADYNFVSKNNYQAVDVNPLHQSIGDPGGWNTWKWWEPHGINGGDPKFVNESQLDFRLKEGSPLIGKALPLNQLFTTDMRGTTRGAKWDIGALQFQAGGTVFYPIPPNNLRLLAR